MSQDVYLSSSLCVGADLSAMVVVNIQLDNHTGIAHLIVQRDQVRITMMYSVGKFTAYSSEAGRLGHIEIPTISSIEALAGFCQRLVSQQLCQ